LIHRCLIAFAPGQEQLANFVWTWRWHLTAALDLRSLKKKLSHGLRFTPQFPHEVARRKVEFATSKAAGVGIALRVSRRIITAVVRIIE